MHKCIGELVRESERKKTTRKNWMQTVISIMKDIKEIEITRVVHPALA
jgi:hypothetical protein